MKHLCNYRYYRMVTLKRQTTHGIQNRAVNITRVRASIVSANARYDVMQYDGMKSAQWAVAFNVDWIRMVKVVLAANSATE